jgi:hypothetical protein
MSSLFQLENQFIDKVIQQFGVITGKSFKMVKTPMVDTVCLALEHHNTSYPILFKKKLSNEAFNTPFSL